ncbi:hypothetical protein [Pseudofulvibacter geojedonensis]|uniref:Uncharacterized protein n=1 Tax=Pseudofulvibacter geojedonensis TaxID=1123758 RepID=A0ABW3I1R2_9FLAO
MLQAKLQEIAINENGKYNRSDLKADADWGSHLHFVRHQLDFEYKGIHIYYMCDTGHHNTATIRYSLPSQSEKKEFEVFTKDVLYKLFNRKKDWIHIKGNDSLFKNHLQKSDSFLHLNKLAKEFLFEPTIKGKSINLQFEVSCKYHLLFERKDEVLAPLFSFHKTIIDYLN